MTPKDWFGVLVRGGGLYMLVVAIGQGIAAITEGELGGLPEFRRSHVVYCITYLVLGIISLRGANMIVRFAYPEEPARPSSADNDSPPA
jgi:hypothetical protein